MITPAIQINPLAPDAPRLPDLQRLPGFAPTTGWGMLSCSSRLWLGADSLLQVQTQLLSLTAQRFLLRDIHALQLRRTARGLIWSIVLGSVAAFTALIAWGSGAGGLGFNILAGIAAVCAILMVFNILCGTTARATIVTAVGVQHLPSLARMRPARRAFTAIVAQVESVQGALTLEEAARALTPIPPTPEPAREVVAP